MSHHQPNPFVRFLLAVQVFLRVIFDAKFGAAVQRLARGDAEAGAPPTPKPSDAAKPPRSDAKGASPGDLTQQQVGALQLLRLLQRDGRFVDFVQQDIVAFEDAQVGSAARVVHEGCRKALASWTIDPISSGEENRQLTLESQADASSGRWKLTGNVGGAAPHQGMLRHRGWSATECPLPALVGDEDIRVLAPAELEVA